MKGLGTHNPLSSLFDIQFPDVKKANWNCSYDHCTTGDVCYVNVVHNDRLMANTNVDFDINQASFANPTIAPLYGRYRVKYLAFFAPDRLYIPKWKDGSKVEDDDYPYPVILPYNISANLTASDDPSVKNLGNGLPYVAPTSLCHQLGLYPAYYQPYTWRETGVPVNTREQFIGLVNNGTIDYPSLSNGFSFLAYWDIYRNYIANTQEEYCYARNKAYRNAHSRALSNSEVVQVPALSPTDFTIQRSELDKFFDLYSVNMLNGINDVVRSWYEVFGYDPLFADKYCVYTRPDSYGSLDVEHALLLDNFHYGLAIAPYIPDQFTSWINTEQVELERQQSAVKVENGKILMEQWVVASRIQNKIRKSLFKQSDFAQYIDVQYGVRPSTSITKPMFLGAFVSDIIFNDVISTTQTENTEFADNGNLGSRAGFGRGTDREKHNFVKFRTEEPGTFMVLQIIQPEVFYFEGRDQVFDKQNFNEEFNPAFDGVGYQDLGVGTMNMVPNLRLDPLGRRLGTSTWNGHNVVVGQQPYAMEHMCKRNTLGGMMVMPSQYLGWSLARSFNYNRGDLAPIQSSYRGLYSSYPFPEMFNNIFKSNVVDNFQFYLSFDYKKYQPLSKQFLSFHN